ETADDVLSSNNRRDALTALSQLTSASQNVDALILKTKVLPRTRPHVEVYEFIAEIFPTTLLRREDLTIELWPELNFAAEPDFLGDLAQQYGGVRQQPSTRIVLFLAEIERGNPLAWSLLVHEVGHVIALRLKLQDLVFESKDMQ